MSLSSISSTLITSEFLKEGGNEAQVFDEYAHDQDERSCHFDCWCFKEG